MENQSELQYRGGKEMPWTELKTRRWPAFDEDEYPGGIEMWQQAIRKAASAARGWVMVGYDLNDGSIFNYIMDSQNLWAVYNMVPVLALDVYEHAYARDYGSTPDGRKQYVDAFFRNVDWEHVDRQLLQAQAAKQGADSAAAEERVPVSG